MVRKISRGILPAVEIRQCWFISRVIGFEGHTGAPCLLSVRGPFKIGHFVPCGHTDRVV